MISGSIPQGVPKSIYADLIREAHDAGKRFLLDTSGEALRTAFEAKPDFIKQYDESLWDKVQEEGTIHYTGGKPWNIFSIRFEEWWRTYDKLPSEIKEEWAPPQKTNLLWKVMKIKPIGLVINGFRNLKQQLG